LYYSEELLGNEHSEENDVDIPDVMKEVDIVLRVMKNGKTPGEDGLKAEIFKLGVENMKEKFAKLFSMCLRKIEIPRSWNIAVIILLHKKGDKKRAENYRPISLLLILYKCSLNLF